MICEKRYRNAFSMYKSLKQYWSLIRRVARLLRMLKSLLRSTQISNHNLLSLLHVVTARNHALTQRCRDHMMIINTHYAQLFGIQSSNVTWIMRHDYAQIYPRNEATVILYRNHVCLAMCTHSAAIKEAREERKKKRGKKEKERLEVTDCKWEWNSVCVCMCVRVRVCMCVCM